MATQWDSVNKKKVYAGKYPEVTKRGQGYFGNNTAGNPQEFVPKDWGTKRKFIGSNTKEYTFSDDIHGTLTITADSYAEALRIAQSRGYIEEDYKRKRRRSK